jgi:hypothetical protein
MPPDPNQTTNLSPQNPATPAAPQPVTVYPAAPTPAAPAAPVYGERPSIVPQEPEEQVSLSLSSPPEQAVPEEPPQAVPEAHEIPESAPAAVSMQPRHRWSWLKNKYFIASNVWLVLIIAASVPVWLTFSTKLSNLADSVGISFSSELAVKQHTVMGIAAGLILLNVIMCVLKFKWLAALSIAASAYSALLIYNQRPDGAPGVKAALVFWAALGLVVIHVLIQLLILVRVKKTQKGQSHISHEQVRPA